MTHMIIDGIGGLLGMFEIVLVDNITTVGMSDERTVVVDDEITIDRPPLTVQIQPGCSVIRSLRGLFPT